jgi:hypothetical protein
VIITERPQKQTGPQEYRCAHKSLAADYRRIDMKKYFVPALSAFCLSLFLAAPALADEDTFIRNCGTDAPEAEKTCAAADTN